MTRGMQDLPDSYQWYRGSLLPTARRLSGLITPSLYRKYLIWKAKVGHLGVCGDNVCIAHVQVENGEPSD